MGPRTMAGLFFQPPPVHRALYQSPCVLTQSESAHLWHCTQTSSASCTADHCSTEDRDSSENTPTLSCCLTGHCSSFKNSQTTYRCSTGHCASSEKSLTPYHCSTGSCDSSENTPVTTPTPTLSSRLTADTKASNLNNNAPRGLDIIKGTSDLFVTVPRTLRGDPISAEKLVCSVRQRVRQSKTINTTGGRRDRATSALNASARQRRATFKSKKELMTAAEEISDPYKESKDSTKVFEDTTPMADEISELYIDPQDATATTTTTTTTAVLEDTTAMAEEISELYQDPQDTTTVFQDDTAKKDISERYTKNKDTKTRVLEDHSTVPDHPRLSLALSRRRKTSSPSGSENDVHCGKGGGEMQYRPHPTSLPSANEKGVRCRNGAGGGGGCGEGREVSVKVVLLGDYGVGKTHLLAALYRAATATSGASLGASSRASSGASSRASLGASSRASSGASSRASSGASSRASSGASSRASLGASSRASSGASSRASLGASSRASSGAFSRASLGASSGASSRASSGASSGASSRASLGASSRASWKASSSPSGFSCAAYRPREYVELTACRRGRRIRVKVADTAGQERFRSMTSSYFRGAQGCFLVFNVTRKESFEAIPDWYSDMQQYAPDATSAVLLGVTTPSQSRDAREVTSQRAFQLAEALGTRYLEASTEDADLLLAGVEHVIDSALDNIRDLEASAARATVTIYPRFGDHTLCHKFSCCAS